MRQQGKPKMNLKDMETLPQKERGKGKETFPTITPYREKGREKEIW
jgi:hypothetical protein